MDGATLLTLQGPMGLGHSISCHLHPRVHPLHGHNSVFMSLIMAFIFGYYLWAKRHQRSIDYKLPRECTNGPCYLVKFIYSEKVTKFCKISTLLLSYVVVTARLSGILKAKQKLGRTFNSDKLGGIAFTKISKLTMCSA